MVNFKKLLPFIVFGAVGFLVFILTIVSLVIPWYTITATSALCGYTSAQGWDNEIITTSGSNCTGVPTGTRAWRTTCDVDFCKNKAAVFVITRGLLAYACVGTFVALVVYLVGAFGPGRSFQAHATGATIFCTGLCSLLPIALGVFLFGIGITAGVHQDQVDYYTNVNTTRSNGQSFTVDNIRCQLAVSCTSFAGSAVIADPCTAAPYGCFAQPNGNPSGLSVNYSWNSAGGFIVAIIAGLLALASVPTMAIWGLRRKKTSLLSDADPEGDEDVPMTKATKSKDEDDDDE